MEPADQLRSANLSNDYFTDRQDRYHVFSSPEITEYFERVHQAICKLSFSVLPSKEEAGYVLEWRKDNLGPSPLDDAKSFIKDATTRLESLIHHSALAEKPGPSTSTLVYPLLQFTPLLRPDTSTELPAMRTLLGALAKPGFEGSKWTFTAGYFNMTPEVRQLLLNSNPARATVIAASPWANGFYGSKGVSGMLPAAYSHLARQFLNAVAHKGLSDRIAIKEWRRGTVNEPGGWTYHAKGLWITLPNESAPTISLVGSSNYTQRSYNLDLEANALIVTRDRDLMKRLGEEESWLQEYAQKVDVDDFARLERRVGFHVRIAMWIVTLLGGAL
jgi:CDP-diacylglycerol--glycerol-3-phosphate 3-phosphatidyltransferase